MWTVTILRPRQYTSFTGVTGMDMMLAYSFPKRKRKVGENGSHESQEDDRIYTLSPGTGLHGGGNA